MTTCKYIKTQQAKYAKESKNIPCINLLLMWHFQMVDWYLRVAQHGSMI